MYLKYDVIIVFNFLVLLFDLGFELVGIIDKMILDVIILVVLEIRGYYFQFLDILFEIEKWEKILMNMM